jgi:tRNA A-37 threonylcarbamoyl transferase component Bud32
MDKKTILYESHTKTIYREGDKVVKMFGEDYSKANVLNEALNHARVEDTGLNIPRLHEVKKIDGKWAIVIDYIEGKTLKQLMEENPQRKEEYIEKLVDIQIKILSHRVPLLNKLRDKMHSKISMTELDATTRYELHTRLDSAPRHNKVCHGDLHPSNIIITADGSEYIIDWAHVTQGNGAAAAARVYLLLTLDGERELAEKYLTTFCLKTDTAMQYVQQWIPIVAASQLTKGKEQERDLLLRWTDVVDYE